MPPRASPVVGSDATGQVPAARRPGTLVMFAAPRRDGPHVKRWHYFTAGVALGVAATRRSRRAREAAKAALAAKLTPSAIAADIADAIAEIGNAVGSFASDVRMGAVNRRAAYRPMIDGANGSVVMVPAEQVRQIAERRSAAERDAAPRP